MTLNQLIAALRRAGENHKMIRAVYVGPEYDLAAQQGQDNYPMLWVIPDTVTMQAGDDGGETEQTFRFALAVAERVYHDQSNHLDALSDTQQLLQDVLATLQYVYRNSNARFAVNDDAEPFFEQRADTVSGYAIRFEVSVPFTRDFCAVPSNDYAFPNIDAEIQVIDGGYYNSIYSLTIDGGIEA